MREQRERALAALREHLFALAGLARVRITPEGARRGWLYQWPERGIARSLRFEEVKHVLEGLERGALVEVQERHDPDDLSSVFPWPPAKAGEGQADAPAPDKESTIAAPASAGQVVQLRALIQGNETEKPEVPLRLVSRPPKASPACALHILAALYAEQKRMTASRLVEVFATGSEWSLSTVEATCSWLVSDGKLDNGRDGRGRGYGLADWERKPDFDSED